MSPGWPGAAAWVGVGPAGGVEALRAPAATLSEHRRNQNDRSRGRRRLTVPMVTGCLLKWGGRRPQEAGGGGEGPGGGCTVRGGGREDGEPSFLCPMGDRVCGLQLGELSPESDSGRREALSLMVTRVAPCRPCPC